MLFFCFLLNLLRASSVVRVWLPPSATSRRKACGAGQRPPYVSRHCAGLAKRPPALYKFSSFAVSKSPPARSPDPASDTKYSQTPRSWSPQLIMWTLSREPTGCTTRYVLPVLKPGPVKPRCRELMAGLD
jgi:hypothetical protein